MLFTRPHRVQNSQVRFARVVACFIPLFVLALVADHAFGQAGGVRRGGGGGGQKSGGRQPQQPRDNKPAAPTPGQEHGTILKYEVSKKESDIEKGVTGYLTVRPFEKGAKMLKLSIFKPDDEGNGGVIVKVGDHQFESDDVSEYFWSGLYCTAGWGFKDENAKVKVKELRTLTLDTIDITGKVESVDGDVIVIRATPSNGREWPHLETPPDSRAPAPNAPPKKPRQLKVSLKLIEDVSRVVDQESDETSLSSFEPGQMVDARIVFSSKTGMLVRMSPPGVDPDVTRPSPDQPDDGDSRGDGGRKPPPGGTRRGGPRGGG